MNALEPALASGQLPKAGAPLLELRGINRRFMRGDLVIDVLHDISLSVNAGEFVAIMGASGSGKSTLMNILGCLDRPTSGSYLVDGREVQNLDQDARAQLRCSLFGFIFQQYHLIATANALENAEIPAIYAGIDRAQRMERARQLLSSLGLADRLDHRPNQLSGGQQQRVSIARALMNGGQIILADEPSGALDSRSGEEVMRLLADLNRRGHTVLLITHDMAVAKRARRIIEIRDGRIVSDRANEPVEEAAHTPAPGAEAADFRWAQAGKRYFSLFDVAEAVKMAIGSLKVNIFRTVLTLLGIIIGVASVITMLAIGDGAKQSVMNTITAMGTNLLLIRPGAPNMRMQGQVTATLVPADAEAIARLPNVAGAVPEFPTSVTVRYGNFDYVTSVNSTTPEFSHVRDWDTQQGAFFTDADLRSYAPVVALGQTVARNLSLDPKAAIGKFVLLNNIPFQVIGVMAPKGATPFGTDMDDVVFIPLTTGRLRIFGQQYVRTITVQVEDVAGIYATQSEIQRLLIARHKVEDFQIRNMEAILQSATDTQATLTILLGSVAAISLLVGGIGVMNIMLVSVTERTREIGVRMATGARPINILLQFNTEALAVCIMGGLIGVGLGIGAAYAFMSFGRPIVFSAGPIILAFGCAVATGLLFGFLPARKAAKLDPVAALAAE